MAENSKIEWCKHTWNPWIGCTAVSPACLHCYAEELMDHRYGRVIWGAGEGRVRTTEGTWNHPIKWNREAAAAGRVDTVFCLSLGDIWDNEVDQLWRNQAFDRMRETPNLLYLLLSKRIGNAERMTDVLRHGSSAALPPNAALGATMVDQDEWDRDMTKLKRAGEVLGARFTFASVEPMLGEINARGLLPDWVIVGGESGRDARPLHPQWARSLRDQCAAADVPFFFKQWGEWVPGGHPAAVALAPLTMAGTAKAMSKGGQFADGQSCWQVGKKAAGRLLDGIEHSAKPVIQKEAA